MRREYYSSRSYSYQYKIFELSWLADDMKIFVDDSATPYEKHVIEQIDLLKIDLLETVKEIISTELTLWQKMVVRMYYFQNKTMEEIAKELSCQQSSVTKSLFGNEIYSNGESTGKVGGSIPKLKRLCKSNSKIISILAEIEELSNSI